MIVFDTYAWVEYFLGSGKGAAAKKYVDSSEEIAVSSLCLAELKIKYGREKLNADDRIQFVRSRCIIADVTETIALTAAEQRLTQHLHLVDAVMYATALSFRAKLLTGDKHFEKLEMAELLH